MYKKLTTAVVVGLLSSSIVNAGDQPYVAFDVIELKALSPTPDDVLSWSERSFGVAINSANRIAGISDGSTSIRTENEVSGEVNITNLVLLQPVRYDYTEGDLEVTPESFIPEPNDGELGIGLGELGIVPIGINSVSDIVAYAADIEIVEAFGRDSEGECNTQVVQTSVNARKAVVINESGSITEIPLPEGFTSMTPTAINEAGQVVGRGSFITDRDECTDPTQIAVRGFVYEPSDQSVQVISTLENEGENQNSAVSNVRDINGSTIVGNTSTLLDDRRVIRGFISSLPNVELTMVEGFGGPEVTLNVVNDSGIAAGGSSNADDATIFREAFIYDSNEQASTRLGFLSTRVTFPFSEAYSINNHNEVVGTSRVSQTPDSVDAFLYDDGEMMNLNSLIDCTAGWTLAEARDINDEGYIVGTGTRLVNQDDGTQAGEVRAFLLKPRSTPADRSCDPVVESSGGGLGWVMLLLSLATLRRRLVQK